MEMRIACVRVKNPLDEWEDLVQQLKVSKNSLKEVEELMGDNEEFEAMLDKKETNDK
jgi:methyl coenzyme M reductase subunit C-like uncharacterized protein (methanogenesis marker protein 7)